MPALPAGLGVPAAVERVIRRATAKTTEARFQSANDMADAPEGALGRTPAAGAPTPPSIPPRQPRVGAGAGGGRIGGIPGWLFFGGLGVVVMAAITLVAAMVLGGNGGDPVQVVIPPTLTPEEVVVNSVPQEMATKEASVAAVPEEPTGEVANVKQAIKRVYQLINDQRCLDGWESYTPEFRKECSYNSYKSHTQGVTFRNFRNRSVTGFSDIEIQGRIALATFNVAYDSPEGGRLVMTVR